MIWYISTYLKAYKKKKKKQIRKSKGGESVETSRHLCTVRQNKSKIKIKWKLNK